MQGEAQMAISTANPNNYFTEKEMKKTAHVHALSAFKSKKKNNPQGWKSRRKRKVGKGREGKEKKGKERKRKEIRWEHQL